MFFGLRPEKATLSDSNAELINCYLQIKEDWRSVWNGLTRHVSKHSADFYYDMREKRLRDPRQRAIRFLYLNRACFNGIYRVNLNGVFNVPIGSKDVLIYDYDNFEDVWSTIQAAKFQCADFSPIIQQARRGDFVFCDPPYTIAHSGNGFIKYNDKLFRWEDQVRLRDTLLRAHRRGVYTLLTNADFPGIRELYDVEGFSCKSVSRFSHIAAKNSSRGDYGEVLISNYPLEIEI